MKRVLLVALALLSNAALAEEAVGASGSGNVNLMKAAFYFLAVGLAAFGGTTAQSRAAVAALEGIARNPGATDKIMTPMILSLALMESLVIFTLISVFLI
ncbi:MAG: ATP synthase F0 subunit C [Bdellovibrio sp.]|nr:ATP synthase F0 subunit C [Bdellovibrio sp.]